MNILQQKDKFVRRTDYPKEFAARHYTYNKYSALKSPTSQSAFSMVHPPCYNQRTLLDGIRPTTASYFSGKLKRVMSNLSRVLANEVNALTCKTESPTVADNILYRTFSPQDRPQSAVNFSNFQSIFLTSDGFSPCGTTKMCKKKEPTSTIKELTRSNTKNSLLVTNVMKNIKAKCLSSSKSLK